jgi:S-adenosyl-L-methionine hydrolase (adenosine-forming)
VKKRAIVSFLSDYGLQDEFVGICHGVMLRIAPHIRIVDIHHSILRQDIRHGAVVLSQSIPPWAPIVVRSWSRARGVRSSSDPITVC